MTNEATIASPTWTIRVTSVPATSRRNSGLAGASEPRPGLGSVDRDMPGPDPPVYSSVDARRLGSDGEYRSPAGCSDSPARSIQGRMIGQWWTRQARLRVGADPLTRSRRRTADAYG